MKPVIIIAIAFVLLIPAYSFAVEETLSFKDHGFSIETSSEWKIEDNWESSKKVFFKADYLGTSGISIVQTDKYELVDLYKREFIEIKNVNQSLLNLVTDSLKTACKINRDGTCWDYTLLNSEIITIDGEKTISVKYSATMDDKKTTVRIIMLPDGENYWFVVAKAVGKDAYFGEFDKSIQSFHRYDVATIPEWIKNNVKWWAAGSIDDGAFVSGIEFLISEGVIDVPIIQKTASKSDEIPTWVRTNAEWWADGTITDSDFVSGIEFLVNSGIISVKQTKSQIDPPSLQLDAGPADTEITQETWLCSGNAGCFTGIVTSVIDGDTIKVDGQSVRFAMASAPELDEDGGKAAKKFTEVLCPVGSIATVDEDDGQTQGSYGRIIGVIHCNGVNLNAELVESKYGYLITDFCSDSEFENESWVQKHGCSTENFDKGCTKDKPHLWSDGFCYAETEYLDNGCTRNYPHPWSDGMCHTVSEFLENNCPRGYPYVWSDGKCYNLPEPVYEKPVYDDTPQCDPSYPDFCIEPNSRDLDCDEIPYTDFRVYYPDPHGFDADYDGIGCETYSPPEPTPPPVESTTVDCDPSYPDFCIPSPPPDLDCGDIPQKNFTVLQPDPHRFDGDKDGIGCES